MKLLTLALAALALACEAPQLVNPNCNAYVAIPGEPCRPGFWLFTGYDGRAVPVCRCEEVRP